MCVMQAAHQHAAAPKACRDEVPNDESALRDVVGASRRLRVQRASQPRETHHLPHFRSDRLRPRPHRTAPGTGGEVAMRTVQFGSAVTGDSER